jgi:transcriptional regulator with XRE-family HTH domain
MNPGRLFGKRIQKIRKTKRLSQQQVAARAGIEPKYLSLIETGRQQPAFAKTAAIANALGVPIAALFAFDGEDNDDRELRRRIDALLQKSSSEQVKAAYRVLKAMLEP